MKGVGLRTPLLMIALLAAGCRVPATRTVSVQTGRQCWSQVHLVCRLERLPAGPATRWLGLPLPWSRPGGELTLELIYPHPEKGASWALALLHRQPPATGKPPGTAKEQPTRGLAISKTELDRLLLALQPADPAVRFQETTPRGKVPPAATVTVRGTVDGQAFFAPAAEASPWHALAQRLQRHGRLLQAATGVQQAFRPAWVVQVYRRLQWGERPLPVSGEEGPATKKTARVFRLPGLK